MALRIDDVDLHRDRALVERFQAGDPGAFDGLYLRYFQRLKRFCLKRVGDPYEAEEIAQEAFARAYRALPTFGGERRFYPWMTVIAGRLCVDSHRRRERSQPSAEIELGAVDGGQEQIVDRVDVMQLGQAMERLAPRHREVLEFREQESWSYQRIADHYGVSLGTVEALLFRARKALKREFLAITQEHPGWAAVPVFGAIVRRLGSLRARLEELLPGVAPLAGTAAAVVIAVGGTTAVIVGHQSGPAPVPILRAAATAAPADLPAPPAVVPIATSTPTATTPATTPTRSSGVQQVVAGQTVTNYDQARRDSTDKPVSGEAPGVAVVGVDPTAAPADVIQVVHNYFEAVNR